MSKPKKILITGGAGLIGSHLAKRLVKLGNYVIVMDNFFTGSKKNLSSLTKLDNFELIEHDITKPFKVEVQEIYNLACPASPINYQKSPIKTVETCVLGAINCLELARTINAKVLQASTSEIYGNPQKHPQNENYWGNVNPIGIRSCYDEGKRVSETLFFDFHREANVDIRIARIFNTYGPNMSSNDGRVISNFIFQALINKDITVYGDGIQTRCFCYITDMVEGLISLMDFKDFTGPINLGSPNEITIKKLAELIINLCGSKSSIEYCKLPQDDPVQRQPDISLAQKKLNWTPKISLEEGLKTTIDYFKSIIEK
jgi:UDP-glucuronate decarboxylase